MRRSKCSVDGLGAVCDLASPCALSQVGDESSVVEARPQAGQALGRPAAGGPAAQSAGLARGATSAHMARIIGRLRRAMIF